MAKQLINPVERHFEKGILGIAGLLLIGVIARYLVTSPNQLELDGQKVTPGTIDMRLAQKAISIQERIRNAKVDVELPEALYPDFESSLAPLDSSGLLAAVAIGPDIPTVDQAGDLVGQAKLVDVFRMKKPQITKGRSTFEIERDTEDLSYLVSNWVTVTGLFDVKQQSERQRLAYGATRSEVVFGPIELQRRKQRPDGSWSDEEWEYVDSWPAAKLPRIPSLTLKKKGGKNVFSREERKLLENFFEDLEEPSFQLELLRPMMPAINNGTEWKFPIFISLREVLMQDDEYLFPNDPPATNPYDRYGLSDSSSTTESATLTDAQKHAQRLTEGDRFLKLARQNHSVDDAVRAYNAAISVIKDPSASPSLKNKAEKLKDKAELAETDAKIWNRQHSRQPVLVQGGDEDKPARQKLPVQQVWVHDAHRESVASDQTYQYRIRATIYNKLAGEPLKFADPQHATMIFIPGEWSEPSDPVIIPPDIEFYITSADNKRNEVGFEIYRWFEGVWVKSRRFKYTIGDEVSGQSNVQIPSPEIIGESVRATAVFDTGATVIDIDFYQNYRDRKSGGRTRKGVKFGPLDRGTAIVYVDEYGELHERWILTEKGHPAKKSARARVWKP